MNDKNCRRDLTREEELLLSRYYDGECNFFERWKVRRLQAGVPYAESYLDSLNEVGKQVCVYESATLRDENGESIKLDLWDKISKRIDEEQRAALFLGNRESKASRRKWFEFDLSGLAWGVSGSVVTAAFALFLVRSEPLNGGSQQDLAAAGADSQQRPISFASTAASTAPQFENSAREVAFNNRNDPSARAQASKPMRRSIEMDWVRSDGRVEMIQDPIEQSPIIWVNRSRIPMQQFELQDKSGTPNADRPVIIKERIPRGITVAGPR